MGLTAAEIRNAAGDSMAVGKQSFGQAVGNRLDIVLVAVVQAETEGKSSCSPPSSSQLMCLVEESDQVPLFTLDTRLP